MRTSYIRRNEADAPLTVPSTRKCARVTSDVRHMVDERHVAFNPQMRTSYIAGVSGGGNYQLQPSTRKCARVTSFGKK